MHFFSFFNTKHQLFDICTLTSGNIIHVQVPFITYTRHIDFIWNVQRLSDWTLNWLYAIIIMNKKYLSISNKIFTYINVWTLHVSGLYWLLRKLREFSNIKAFVWILFQLSLLTVSSGWSQLENVDENIRHIPLGITRNVTLDILNSCYLKF